MESTVSMNIELIYLVNPDLWFLCLLLLLGTALVPKSSWNFCYFIIYCIYYEIANLLAKRYGK